MNLSELAVWLFSNAFSSGIVWLSKKHYLSQATVQLTLFGKESFVDLDFDQIEMIEVDDSDSKL